ncbi:uncharacterized protein DEA37_0007729 [Paragonimus westermani]|uniref:C2H2-type domain-containing protein n=1 Tax=Paragonimus westermani TaxID=34504 RepID=A0A5J4N730_9TREM|nr:uncharacterized protein DEA37_0007729 [Paragonimus westermani]
MLRPCLVRVDSVTDPMFIDVNKLMSGCRTRLSDGDISLKNSDVACEECDVVSPDRAQAVVHEASCHRHICAQCSSTFVNNHLLLVHEAQHNNYFSSRMNCPLQACDTRSLYATSYQQHIEGDHCLHPKCPLIEGTKLRYVR